MTLTRETKEKIGLLQQALWKLEAAQLLIKTALGDTDVAVSTNASITEVMEDIEADIAELYPEVSQ